MKKLNEIKNWEELKNEVVCGDCLEGMKLIPDKSIDIILTDPPYGKSWCRNNGKTNGFGTSGSKSEHISNLTWDECTPPQEYFDEMFRISKNQIIFGGNYFHLPPSNCWIVWDKVGNMDVKNPFADCELAWTSLNSVVKKFTFRQQGFISDSKDARVHPTQKPVELMRWILENYSNPDDLICDPFMGSWTTARACKDLNRDFIGFELSEKYCSAGEKRLQQQNLF